MEGEKAIAEVVAGDYNFAGGLIRIGAASDDVRQTAQIQVTSAGQWPS
jgi:hypothetical protein